MSNISFLESVVQNFEKAADITGHPRVSSTRSGPVILCTG